MQRKLMKKPSRLRAVSQRPSNTNLNRSIVEIREVIPVLLITKAPVHRSLPKEISTTQLQAVNDLLRRRSAKLLSVGCTQIFKELKTQFTKKQDQIRRLRDIAEFVGVMRSSDFRTPPVIHDPQVIPSSSAAESENAALKKHLHKLEQAVTELRLELYKAKQDCDSLRGWLGRMGLDENSEYFEPAFDVDSMTYEQLLALEDRIGYVKVGLSLSARSVPPTQRLPTLTLSGKDAEELCCVCLQQFGEGGEAKKLPSCGHMFHGKCIDEWLEMKKTCPLCVTEVEA